MIKVIKLLLGYYRNFWGFCPACNSDAPEMYNCYCCLGDRVFPPDKQTKKERMNKFIKKEIL
jgi:hypothetical protein